MAEMVFYHGPGKPDGRFTVQVVFDSTQPKLEQYAGRVLDMHGAKVFQSVWCSGNDAAIQHAERWCKSPQAREHTHAPAEAPAAVAQPAPTEPPKSSQPAEVQAPSAAPEHSDGAGPAHEDEHGHG